MKEHAESEGHIHACQIETSSATALLRGSIAQQLQRAQESERLKQSNNKISTSLYTLPCSSTHCPHY